MSPQGWEESAKPDHPVVAAVCHRIRGSCDGGCPMQRRLSNAVVAAVCSCGGGCGLSAERAFKRRRLSNVGSRTVKPPASFAGSSTVAAMRGSSMSDPGRPVAVDTGALGSQRGSRVGNDTIAPSANSLAGWIRVEARSGSSMSDPGRPVAVDIATRRGSSMSDPGRPVAVDTGAMGSQRGALGRNNTIAPSANSLAKQYHLPLSEVTKMILVFTEGHLSHQSTAAGFSQNDFKAVLCTYFCCKDIVDRILDSAYKAADCLENPFDIKKFLEWYVQNMVTVVSKLNASSHQYAQCSVSVIAKTKLQFDKFDLDKSGGIDYQEYVKMLHSLLKSRDGDLGDARLKKFWMEMHANGVDIVTFPVFTNWYLKYFAEGYQTV